MNARVPVPTHRTLVVLAWAVVLATVGLVAFLVITVFRLMGADDFSLADRADIRDEVDTIRAEAADDRAAREALTAQVESLGETPVVQPGATLPPNLRFIPVPGEDGSDGDDGGDGTDGTDGTDGGDGTDGEPGGPGADGIDGQDGTDGTDGEDGTDGRDGDDAPRIAFIECDSITPFTLTVGLDDGTTYSVECSFLEPVPDPAE